MVHPKHWVKHISLIFFFATWAIYFGFNITFHIYNFRFLQNHEHLE